MDQQERIQGSGGEVEKSSQAVSLPDHIFKKILKNTNVGYDNPKKSRSKPVLGPYTDRIDELLLRSRRQLTNRAIFFVLLHEGYRGSLSTV